MVGYSRSTVANVETGRQHVPPDFWKRADAACHADGAMIGASARVEAMARRERQDAARRGGLAVPDRDGGFDAGAEEALEPISGKVVPAPDDGAGWPDMIAAAASEARGHAEQAAVTGIGPGTVEQLTADVARLSRAYVSAPPLPLFVAMHRTLDQVETALDQKVYPAQARDLNFLAGALCGLMANACLDLGREEAADDLARAAWTHGRIIDHAPLMGWARGTQALAAIWDHRYADAARHAEDGLVHVPTGLGAARLHAIHARALAACGDAEAARAAMTAAEKAMPRGAAETNCMTVSAASSRSMRRSSGTTWRLRCWTPGIRPGPSTPPPRRSPCTRPFRREPAPTAARRWHVSSSPGRR